MSDKVIARIDGLKIFRNCYAAILAALDAINKDKASNDADVLQRAGGIEFMVEFIVCLDLTKESNINPNKKRTAEHQMHRVNVPANTTSDYYKRAVTIPFLDQLLG